jgi:hypothetical protein
MGENGKEGMKKKINANSVCKKEVIVSILNNISKEYATQRFINLLG